jgi:hypothetical protein
MTLKNVLLALLVGFGAFGLCPSFADPPDCDSKCRLRQYHYRTVSSTYRKYETSTCELCTGTATNLCLVDAKDANTAATCTTMAGQEKGNKYWEIASKTVCDFGDTAVHIQCEPAEPTAKITTEAAIKYCPNPK